MTDTYDDLVPLLERMSLEQIPECDRPRRQVFGLPASCPSCGGELELVNTTADTWLAVGILRCPPCRRQWEATVRLVAHHVKGR